MPLTLNTNTQVPIVSWATRPMTGEEQATACQVANAPFVQPHVALMADVHHSSGVLVGSVIPTKGVVYPSAVGRDIGCGMLARKLTLRADLFKPKKLARARAEIERLVAVGTNYHTNPEDDVLGWSGWDRFEQLHPEVRADHQRALTQMGTLGDGNHFIEICVEPDQGRESNIWVVLHSGSRGIGHQLGEIHFESAKIYTGQSGITVPNTFFSFLREGTSEFAAYWSDMQWAMDYAQANRAIMMARIISYFAELFQQDENSIVAQTIECVHNYVARERHFGEDVFITRKGAIRAGVDDFGIVPGSMGASTYIVRGLANPLSFSSCSHGAGRKMSRTKAKDRFSPADLARQTQGVECDKSGRLLEEIPAAYKNIDEVMAAQSDLVHSVTRLKQIITVKSY